MVSRDKGTRVQSHIKISITESDKDTDGSPKDMTTQPFDF